MLKVSRRSCKPSLLEGEHDTPLGGSGAEVQIIGLGAFVAFCVAAYVSNVLEDQYPICRSCVMHEEDPSLSTASMDATDSQRTYNAQQKSRRTW